MNKKYFIIFCLFLLICGFKETDTVVRVIDGDTIQTKNHGVVRILGIDTYDTNSKMVKKQQERTGYSAQKVKDLSWEGKRYAKKELEGKTITLEKDRVDKDRYNRKLRYIEVDGKDYSKNVLKKDLGNTYCGDKKIKRYKEYNKLSKFKCK